MKDAIKLWITASRALYSTTIVLPCIVGGVVAWYEGSFNALIFALILVALFFANIGANFTNDYFDYLSGVDAIDAGRAYTSKRGSEVLLKTGLPSRVVLFSALISLAITSTIGMYLVVAVDWRILILGVIGVFIAFFYTASPVKLGYRGFGEVACWIGCGPLAVIGTTFALTGRFSPAAAVISIPVGLLVTAILYIGNVPDAEADAQVGKRTISVRFGRDKVKFLAPAFYVVIYASILLGVVFGSLPVWTLLALLTVPMAVQIAKLTRQHYNSIPQYVPAIFMTVRIFMATTMLIVVGFVIGAIF